MPMLTSMIMLVMMKMLMIVLIDCNDYENISSNNSTVAGKISNLTFATCVASESSKRVEED